MADHPRQIAVVRSYHDLRKAICARCDEIRMTREQLDFDAGLTNGHSGKLLSPRAIKKFGNVSLGRVLAATGLVLILAEDDEMRPHASITASITASTPRPQHWRMAKGQAWARMMAARRALKLTASERTAIARKAAQTRWRKERLGP